MKIYGINGYMSGKLGNQVMAVRNGEQIARQYQPIVSNPNTENQVKVRARLKLMSQLSAAMQQYIAIPREGAKSPRNLFTSINFGKSSFANDEATVALSEVQLTKSSVGVAAVSASRTQAKINAQLAAGSAGLYDRVVYCVFAKDGNGNLVPVGSKIVEKPGDPSENPTYEAEEIATTASAAVVYAYGIIDGTPTAKAYFQNLNAPSAQDIAKIVTSRVLESGSVTLTQTTGATVAAQA